MTLRNDFGWPVTVMLYDDHVALTACVKNFWDVLKSKQIVVFGAGIRGSVFSTLLKTLGLADFLFSDNNPEKWGGYIFGHEIVPPSYLEQRVNDIAVLISVENADGIEQQLSRMGYVENRNLFPIKTNIYESYINEMIRPISAETIVVGDCGLSQIAIVDADTINLASMLRHEFGEGRTKVLAMHGMGMRSFYTAIRTQLRLNPTIRNLILMINFEVFTGKHHLLPRTQHPQLIEGIVDLLDDPDDAQLEYVQCVKERSENLKLDVVSSNSAKPDDNARLVLYMNYLYSIRKDTEDMLYLFKIVDLVKNSKINFLPYIPPVNYDYACKVVGDQFKEIYDDNRKKMSEWLREKGCEVLDLSYLLHSSEFAAPTTIDETANYNGRIKILEELVAASRDIGIVS